MVLGANFGRFVETLMEKSTWGEEWPPRDLCALSVHMSKHGFGPVHASIIGKGQFTTIVKLTTLDFTVAVKLINDTCTDDDIEFSTREFIFEARVLLLLELTAGDVARHIGQFFHSAMLAPLAPVLFLDAYDNYYDLSVLVDGKFHYGCNEEWLECMRQVLFHVFFTLAQLQQHYPGFRHNDLKDNNVLICLLSAKEQQPVHYKLDGVEYLLDPIVVDTKIIDFATSHSAHADIRNPQVLHGSYEPYGITDLHCPLYDVHFLMMCMMMRLKRVLLTSSVSVLLQFFEDVIPSKYFKGKYINEATRLTLAGQKQLTDDTDMLYRTPAQILLHSFFEPCVACERAEMDMEMERMVDVLVRHSV